MMVTTNLWRRLATFAALVLLVAGSAVAQLQSGNLYGTVADDQGAPLPGVSVALAGTGAQSQVTDEQGRFRFIGLAPGTYALTAELEGFGPISYPNVAINIGRNTEISVTMNAAVTDVITVTTESPLLDKGRVAVTTTVAQTELESIPTSRDPWAILGSTPGVLTDRINVGGNESGQQTQYVGPGSHGDQAVWSVDGVVITDMAALGSSPAYYDFDSFEEMQVTTGGSDASTATGGVVLNMVTKRGTNEFRGSTRYIFGCGTDAAGDTKGAQCFTNMQGDVSISANDLGKPGPWNSSAANPGGNRQPAFAQGNKIQSVEDYGFEVGGPIIKDRFWFWGALAKGDIDLLTLANVRDHTILDTQNLKLNAQILPSNSITASALQSDKQKFGRDAGPTRPQATTWNQSKFGPDPTTWKIEDTQVFSSNFYLTGMYSRVNGGFQLAPQGGDKTVVRDPVKFNNSYLLYQTERPQQQLKVDGSTFFTTGSLNHELKFGLGTREAEVNSLSHWGGAGLMYTKEAFGTDFDVLLVMRDAVSSVKLTYDSAYIQDTLSFGNLTANIGLNYMKQAGELPAASAGANTVLPGLIAAGSFAGSKLPFDWTDISPRLGLTYALGAERKTLLRASYSRFADQLGSGSAATLSPLYANGYFYVYTTGGRDGNLTAANVLDLNGDGRITIADNIGNSSNISPTTGLPISGAPAAEWADGFSAPQTDELLLGIEHALLPEFVVGLNLTYRRLTDLASQELIVRENGVERLHRQSDYAPFAVTGVLPNGQTVSTTRYGLKSGVSSTGRTFTQNSGFEQEYQGAAITFTKRLSNRWMMRGNFSYNNFEWSSVPQGERENRTVVASGSGVTPQRDGDPVIDRVAGSGKSGGRFLNSKYAYSINGLYQVAPDRPWGFNVAANLSGRQGYPTPYFGQYNNPGNQGGTSSVLLSGTGDDFRLDDVRTIDLRVEKEFSIKDLGLTVGVDMFNATNESTILFRQPQLQTVGSRGSSAGDHVQEVLSPRIFRVGVKLALR